MRFLTVSEVVQLHDHILEQTGGEPGVLNLGHLESAVHRCRSGPYAEPPDLALRAALLLRGIAQDHPFVDGNKRTAYEASDLFLRLNGHFLRAATPEITSFMVSVAMGKLDLDLLTAWLSHHAQTLSPQETEP